jgi:hypothetical protein
VRGPRSAFIQHYQSLTTTLDTIAFLQAGSRPKVRSWQQPVSLKSDSALLNHSTEICFIVDVLDVTPLPGLSKNHPAVPAFSSLVWMHLPQAKGQMPDALERLLEVEVTENLDLHFGDMVISDIGQSIRLQSEMIR